MAFSLKDGMRTDDPQFEEWALRMLESVESDFSDVEAEILSEHDSDLMFSDSDTTDVPKNDTVVFYKSFR